MRKQIFINRVNKKIEKETKSDSDLFKKLLFLLPYSGALLIALGYGYTTGISSQFGYSAKDFLNDISGFLSAAFDPALIISMKFFSWDFLTNSIINSVTDKWLIGYVITFIIIYTFFHLFNRTPEKRETTKRWFVEKLRSVVDSKLTRKRIVIEVLLVAFAGIFLKFLATLMVYVVIVILAAFFLAVPVFGFSAGAEYAKDYIIHPKACTPFVKNMGKEIPKTAPCVRLLIGEKEIVRGREIARNSERIFLYVKEVRKDNEQKEIEVRVPKSFPIRNAIIERVDTEDVLKSAQ